MRAPKKAIEILLFGLLAACAFDRDIPPEQFASEHPQPPDTMAGGRDEECTAPQICVQARCTSPCEDDDTCTPGTCDRDTGRCDPPCEEDDDCPTGTCDRDTGRCNPPCEV